jgi:hypothetical protein
MKRLLVAILLVGLLVSPLWAEGLKELILPSGPRAISLYDWNKTNAFWDGLFLPVAGYRELVYLDVGFLTVIEETTPALGVSLNIPNVLSLIPGVSLKISEPVTFGYAASYNFRNKYWMSGLYLSVKL